jgi:hypothetical protein
MKLRYFAVASTFALVATALSSPVLAQRPQPGAQSVFQRPPVSQGGRFDGPVAQRDRDGRNDPRERELYSRYTGRDSRWQFAFRDGYSEGVRDARAHRRFDPVSNTQYRAANRGFGRGWGPRDQFAIQYRSAFRDGYERGYFDIAQRRTGWSLFFNWSSR